MVARGNHLVHSASIPVPFGAAQLLRQRLAHQACALMKALKARRLLSAFVWTAVGLCNLGTLSAPAAVVTFDMTINGGTDPVVVHVGDHISVEVYAQVTDNTWIYNGNPTEMGLALYSLNLNGSSQLRPVQGADAGKWDAVPSLDMGNFDSGWLSGTDVIQLCDGMGVPTTAKSHYATQRQLLATGTFEATGVGSASFVASDMLTNVVKYESGTYAFLQADPIQAPLSTTITVLPVPEVSTVLLASMIVTTGLGLRPRRSCRFAGCARL